MTVDWEGFHVREEPSISDPPYVYGDHAARCRGCDDCDRLEDEWIAEQELTDG